MTFPTVVDADTKNGTVTSNSNTWTLTYPTNLVSGDLIIGMVGADGGGFVLSTSDGGFNIYNAANGTAVGLSVIAKISNGTETGTFTASINSNEQGGWRLYRITGWYGSGVPSNQTNLENGGPADGNGLAVVGVAAGLDTHPNPPANNPSLWDVEDTLWLAVTAVDTSRTFSAFPASYTNTFSDVSGGSTGASLGGARRTNAVASEDPGTFTISASDDWQAITVAIRPAAAATKSPPPFQRPWRFWRRRF